MKALVKTAPEPGLHLIDVPEPVAGPNEVLVKVLRTGICGTDLHIDQWNPWAQRVVPTPLTIGHEFCGEIVELGSAVEDLEVGMFVSGEGHYVCGRCRACLAGKRHLCRNTQGIGYMVPGCFSEYFAMPASNVWVHRSGVSEDVAAIFDPFGNAVHTALQFPCLGEDVLVTGAGPIGIMAALVAQFAGARHVVVSDLSPQRLELAESLGLPHTVNPAETPMAEVFERFAMKEGFDIGLEMSGNASAFESMLENMYHGGRIALLGILPNSAQIRWDQVIFKGLFIKGIYGREMFETWYKMASLIQSGLDLSPIITHRFKVDDFQQGFDAMRSGQSGKVILSWD